MSYKMTPVVVAQLERISDHSKELKEKFNPTILTLLDFNYNFLTNEYVVRISDPARETITKFTSFDKAIEFIESEIKNFTPSKQVAL